MCLPLSLYKIRERSMEPNFHEGDFVLVNRWAKDFSVGDVVVAHNKKENFIVVKRIKKISRGKFLLAGDSKKSAPAIWIEKRELLGKVIFAAKQS